LVPPGTDYSHQLPGNTGSYTSNSNFAQEKLSISILLRIDNMTAVAYINREVSPTLSRMAKTLWLWRTERNVSLEAQHLPGVMNSIADRESRAWLDRSEWKLSPNIFQKINSQLGPISMQGGRTLRKT